MRITLKKAKVVNPAVKEIAEFCGFGFSGGSENLPFGGGDRIRKSAFVHPIAARACRGWLIGEKKPPPCCPRLVRASGPGPRALGGLNEPAGLVLGFELRQ